MTEPSSVAPADQALTQTPKAARNVQLKLPSESMIVWIFCAIGAVLAWLYAWVSDDGFIYLRIARNMGEGLGMTFNAGDRSQASTSLLWQLLLWPGALLHINLFFWAILVGVALTTAAIYLLAVLARDAGDRFLAALIAIGGFLFTSDTVLQFMTSGLETSVTAFLEISAVYVLARKQNLTRGWLACGLLLITRPDIVPAVVGLAIALALTVRPKRADLVALFVPVVCGELFQKFYYGFWLPNTGYAKVGGNLLATVKSAQLGFAYVIDYAVHEPLQFLLIAVVVCWAMSKGPRRPEFWLGAACVLQLAYVVYVAGDFMRGRFIIPVIWIAAAMIPLAIRDLRFAAKSILIGAGAFAGVGLLAFVIRYPSLPSEGLIGPMGWENERQLWHFNNIFTYRQSAYAGEAYFMRDYVNAFGPVTTEALALGRFGYDLPNVKMLDPLGLPDAFIAHLPILPRPRVGHPFHAIPLAYRTENHDLRVDPEYMQRLQKLDPKLESDALHRKADWTSSALHDYYRRLQVVTAGPLFDPKRLAIVLSPFDAVPWTYAGPPATVDFVGGLENPVGVQLLAAEPLDDSVPTDDRFAVYLRSPYAKIVVTLPAAVQMSRISLSVGDVSCYRVGFGLSPAGNWASQTVRGKERSKFTLVSLPLPAGTLVREITVDSPCAGKSPGSVAAIQWNVAGD